MARRKAKKRRTRRNRDFKLLNAVETVLVGSQATRALFGMNLIPFVTEGWLTPATKSQSSQFGGMGSQWIQGVSAKELLEGLVPGGQTGQFTGSWTIPKALRANLKTFGPTALFNAIAIPVGFRVGKRVFSRFIRPANKMLKDARVGVKLT